MNRPRRIQIGPGTVAALVMAMLVGGCQFKGGPSAPSQPAPFDAGSAKVWWPRPVQIRIYPSTRFITRQGKFLLAANIEPVDAMGDPIKGVGHLRCELFTVAEGQGSSASPGRRLYSWDVNLMTLADQRRYYDPITRGYLLRLELDTPAVTKETTLLRVTFTAVNGDRLESQRTLPIKW